jgi:hypothetical protein
VRSSASRTSHLYPQECSWYSFSLGAELTPGSWYGQKEYVTEKSSDITWNRSQDHLTSSARCLNHYATPGPTTTSNDNLLRQPGHLIKDSEPKKCILVRVKLRADSHSMPCPCSSLIHTCHATPLPCSDSAVSFVKVPMVAGNIRTASPAV